MTLNQRNMRILHLTASLAILMIVWGCQREQLPSPPPDHEQGREASPQSLVGSALIGFAHKRIEKNPGIEIAYSDERWSDATGSPAACGRYQWKTTQNFGFYLSRPGEVSLTWNEPAPTEWSLLCGPAKEHTNGAGPP